MMRARCSARTKCAQGERHDIAEATPKGGGSDVNVRYMIILLIEDHCTPDRQCDLCSCFIHAVRYGAKINAPFLTLVGSFSKIIHSLIALMV